MVEPSQWPENVRFILADGTEHPCEVGYVGLVDGQHMWENTVVPPPETVSFKVEKLPANASIRITWTTEES